jgi:PGF-pre-PGF domain-containing protein
LFFEADGSKFYYVSGGESKVRQYALSTPWNISTASYNNSFSIQGSSIQGSSPNPRGLSFKTDGTRMYTTSQIEGLIYQYTLGTVGDFINPTITINYPTAGQTLTNNNVTINITYWDNVALSECSYTITYGNTTFITNNTRSNVSACDSAVEYKVLPNGSTHILTTTVYDTSGHRAQASRYFNVNTTVISSNGGSSSGGGGGGGSSTVTSSFSTSQSKSVVVDVTNSSTGVTQLQITSNKTTENASVTVTSTQSAPQIDQTSKIYQSFDITLGGIDDIEIINVSINFKINKTWIDVNDRDPLNVTLYRNTGTNVSPIWIALPTGLTTEDYQYYYYLTNSPGFSGYAVVVGTSTCTSGEEPRCLTNNVQQCTNNSWVTTETCKIGCSEGKCTNTNGTLDQIKSLSGKNIFYFVIVLIIVIGIIAAIYFNIKRARKNPPAK